MKHLRLAALLAALILILCVPFGALAQSSAIHSTHAQTVSSGCLPCRVKAMLLALPEADAITIENAAAVTEQLHAIDRIKFDLDDNDPYDMSDVHPHTTRYFAAVEKIRQLTGANLLITKSFALPGSTLQLEERQLQRHC